MQILDNAEAKISNHFEEASDFIEHVELSGKKVLVHCFEGEKSKCDSRSCLHDVKKVGAEMKLSHCDLKSYSVRKVLMHISLL